MCTCGHMYELRWWKHTSICPVYAEGLALPEPPSRGQSKP